MNNEPQILIPLEEWERLKSENPVPEPRKEKKGTAVIVGVCGWFLTLGLVLMGIFVFSYHELNQPFPTLKPVIVYQLITTGVMVFSAGIFTGAIIEANDVEE